MIIQTTAAVLSAISQALEAWANHKELSVQETKNRYNAIGKVMDAAIATKAYLYDSHELGNPSREAEKKLSKAWQKAALAIGKYDEDLFNASEVKALGWADPREWESLKDRAITVNLDAIIKQCEWLRKNIK